MNTLSHLISGFGTALTPQNLMYAAIGSLVGTLVGVLPGLGTSPAIAILLPLTFHLPAVGAIIMLAAIFYGSQYGGTITTVLINLPGEAASVVTLADGHAMALKGRAGVALTMAAIGAFIGGTLSCIGLVAVAAPVANAALHFGPPEYVAIFALGLSLILVFAGRSLTKALIMAAFGMLLATVGLDPISGVQRFTFGLPQLFDGVDIIPVLMGLFGVSEILLSVEKTVKDNFRATMSSRVPSRQDIRDAAPAIGRASVVGFLLGLLPGINSTISAFTAYGVEKRAAKHPEKLGTGMIQGVVAPETADNAHAVAAFIPLFTLGIPGSPSVAILISAFTINGLDPGPQLFTQHPEIVWPIIASMYVGNLMLLVINMPLISIWTKILKIPYPILIGFIFAFTVVGSYSVNGRIFEVWLMLIFGAIGYVLKKLDFPPAPVVLALVIGPELENSLRQSMTIFHGDPAGFAHHPIVIVLAAAALVVVAISKAPKLVAVRRTANITPETTSDAAGEPMTGAGLSTGTGQDSSREEEQQ